ncbi:MAG TPA: serine/threonine-protein kinase [Vicinamibacteria bacterium]
MTENVISDVSAVDLADLVLAASVRYKSPATSVEPKGDGYQLRLLGPLRQVLSLSRDLGEALAVRLALLGELDPFAPGESFARLRVTSGAGDADFLLEVQGDPQPAVRLRAVPALSALDPTLEIHAGTELPGAGGSYRLSAELGRGGMGVVWSAYHLESGRSVAVKVLHSEVAQDARLGMQLVREGRAASLANHPGIVNVTDFGNSPSGRAFLVMELVGADTLDKLLEAGALPLRRALLVGRRIASALQAAHVRGVIHHDLKPSNVFVDAGDHVKIGDFGAAKVLSHSGAELTMTQTGLVLGTPNYMSPERARGHESDERSDLYSRGCILFQMIQGRPPFDADSLMDVLLGHLAEPLPEITSPHGPVPEAVSQVVRKATAKTVEMRYQSAGEIEQDLQKAASALLLESGT